MDWHQWDQCPLPARLHTGHTLRQAGNSWKAGYLLLHLWQGIPDSAPAPDQFFILESFIFQILNLSPPPLQVNLTAKSMNHLHASTLSVCICNNFSLAKNLIKKQLQDISHYHKQISFKESNMLIHSTADNTKEIQMRDYPLASFPPWEVFKEQILKLFTAELWCVQLYKDNYYEKLDFGQLDFSRGHSSCRNTLETISLAPSKHFPLSPSP